MSITYRAVPLNEDYAAAICAWRYPAPYDIFNWPEWADMAQRSYEFGDPGIRRAQYAAILDQSQTLIGYSQFFPMSGVTRLGFGLRPDLCGQGLGPSFVRFIAEEALKRAPGNEIDLEVLAWNIRAQRAYEKAGFEHSDTYEKMTPTGVKTFHCMVLSLI